MITKGKIKNILICGALSLLIAGILIAILYQYLPTKTFMYLFINENWFSPQTSNIYSLHHMNSCTIILGAKLVGRGHVLIDPLAALSGARHLFVNYFLNDTYYGIIEGGFNGTNFGYRGLSTGHIRLFSWEQGGLQWKVPTHQCPELIHCLHIKTMAYHHSLFPYHFLLGPNSNSFMWWIFNQCSIKLMPVFSKYPFVGIDYFSSSDSPMK